MRIDKDIFYISDISKTSVRIIKIKNEDNKRAIKSSIIENFPLLKTILIIVGNDNIEVIRNNKSLILFSAGIITQRIINECKKNNIKFSLSLGFDEEHIRKLIKLPRFMDIIAIITIGDDVESNYEFFYDEHWEPRD
jgi:hypothetical protein